MTARTAGLILVLAAVPALSACATTASDAPAGPTSQVNRCQAAPGQAFIGQTASTQTGAAMLRATNAAEIRWVPPRTMVTMEFKYGRLTVGYDDAMTIASVACS